MRSVLKFLIRAYQYSFGAYLGGRCRFYPSCSEYAIEAIERHGAFRGSAMSLRRLAKCHPLHDGGVDLVPSGKNVS